MKICIPMFEIQDYGGITGHIEYLAKGLKEHGHDVEFVLLRNNAQYPYRRKSTGPSGSYPSVFGGEVHLLAGWYGCVVRSYGDLRHSNDTREYLRTFDFIIWGLPCPYNNEGHWVELYENGVPQVACIHDAHYPKAYKHLDSVVDHLSFLAPVNESAYGALESWPGEKRLINNGHKLADWDHQMPWHLRYQEAICAHVWKAWKRMDRVVAAAPHMKSDLIMGGDGIEGRYMRSKDKCKPKYKGLWDGFVASGKTYLGIIPEQELFDLYLHARVMIDISYAERFASYGCHYNRSIVEALNYGCVPLMNYEAMEGSIIFPKNTYATISDRGTQDPVQFASTVDSIINMNPSYARDYIEEGRKVLSASFDYRRTCLQYLEPIEA